MEQPARSVLRWNRRLGAYGICALDGALLVIEKGQGPYKGLYDLPGGGVEPDESLVAAVCREVQEETGLHVAVESQIGVGEVLVPWTDGGFTHMHQVAAYYAVRVTGGRLGEIADFGGQDATDALWVELGELHGATASPLVLQAKAWLETGGLQDGLLEWQGLE